MASSQDQACANREAAALLKALYSGARHPNELKWWRCFTSERESDNGVTPWLVKISRSAELFDLVHAAAVPESLARALTADTLRAIAHLHKHRIVHRDVKAENIWLTVDGRAVLKGTELATQLSGRDRLVGRVGTPGYIAPEVILGHEYCEKVDTFGMGVVMFFMLAGSLPFDGPLPSKIRKTIGNRVNFNLGQLRTRSEEAREALCNLMEPNPVDRSSAESALRGRWWQYPDEPVSMRLATRNV